MIVHFKNFKIFIKSQLPSLALQGLFYDESIQDNFNASVITVFLPIVCK